MPQNRSSAEILAEMNDRSREVFRRVVEGYLGTGAPIGSRTLTRDLSEKVSAATVRNVMQDLEFLGLLGSPHVSAGRVPTPLGLRLFVDSLLEVAPLDQGDRAKLDQTLGQNDRDVGALLEAVGGALSGVTQARHWFWHPSMKRRSSISTLSACPPNARWSFWFLSTGMSKTGCSRRRAA